MKAAGIAMLDYFWNLSVNLWIWGGGVWGGTAYASMVPIFIPGVPTPITKILLPGGYPLDPRPQVPRPWIFVRQSVQIYLKVYTFALIHTLSRPLYGVCG